MEDPYELSDDENEVNCEPPDPDKNDASCRILLKEDQRNKGWFEGCNRHSTLVQKTFNF